ncbi:MAG: 16S rRNA (cytosine(1402)-N(4))-methyltransferase RsmH [Rickettsiales bacterium]|nr:16S rRNA (cytosine(1402)-N(4))-methyltransferase RsmH [Rickettsiales bacterium]
MQSKKEHISVMLNEVLNYLKPKNGDVILDGTFGAGGYTRAILESCNCKVIGTDRDETVLKFVDGVKNDFKDRFEFYNVKFSEIKNVVEENSLDAIVLDLGVSSMQLDNGNRGFSFNKEAPLTMTMGRNNITAYDVVNDYDEKNIADIIYNFGEEVKSRAIAKKIIEYRKNKAIETTTELADIVRSCFPNKYTKIDFATKTFQAIRIFVNDELKELETILNDSVKLLKSGGRLVVVSFHSLEDRIVKDFLNNNGDCKLLKVNKYKEVQKETLFKVLTKKPVIVSSVEVDKNRRARSAKLRGAVRC